MRSLVLTAPRTLEVLERHSPPLGPGQARLSVEAVGICGSDVHGYAESVTRRPVGVVMGHEIVARVVEASVGSDLPIGARVAVNPVIACGECRACREGRDNLCRNRRIHGTVVGYDGAFATELVVPAVNCIPVDAGADVRGVALIEPMAVGIHAVRLSDVRAGDRVVIVGGGPIGIACAIGVLDAGAHPIISESKEHRRALAESLGAETCDPGELAGLGPEADLAFECGGRTSAVVAAMAGVRPGAAVICVGYGETEITIPVVPLVMEERRLIGSSAYTAADYRETAAVVAARADWLAGIVGLTAGLDDLPDVFEGLATRRIPATKALYLPEAP